MKLKAVAGTSTAAKLAARSGPGRTVSGPKLHSLLSVWMLKEQPETTPAASSAGRTVLSAMKRSKLGNSELVEETVPSTEPGSVEVRASGTPSTRLGTPW